MDARIVRSILTLLGSATLTLPPDSLFPYIHTHMHTHTPTHTRIQIIHTTTTGTITTITDTTGGHVQSGSSYSNAVDALYLNSGISNEVRERKERDGMECKGMKILS